MKNRVIIKNCPFCNNPPKIQIFRSSSGKRVARIYCNHFACEMPVEITGIIPKIAVEAWNEYVDKVKERKKNEEVINHHPGI